MSSVFKKISAVLILISFLTIVLFSFSVMIQGEDGSMKDDCPFSAMGQSICPQDALTAVTHHISSYQSFLNVHVGSGFTALLISLLLLLYATFYISVRLPLLEPVV